MWLYVNIFKFPSFQSVQEAIPKQEEQTSSSDGLVTGQLADPLIDGDGMNNDIGETSELGSGVRYLRIAIKDESLVGRRIWQIKEICQTLICQLAIFILFSIGCTVNLPIFLPPTCFNWQFAKLSSFTINTSLHTHMYLLIKITHLMTGKLKLYVVVICR